MSFHERSVEREREQTWGHLRSHGAESLAGGKEPLQGAAGGVLSMLSNGRGVENYQSGE